MRFHKSLAIQLWRQVMVVTLVAGRLGTNGYAAEQEEVAASELPLEQVKFFEEHIRPLLIDKCFKCHGEEKQSGELRLDSRGGLLLGGDSGPSIVPGSPDESLLIEAVRYESYEMPPDGKLSDEEIDLLVNWVEIGAPWPGDSGEIAVREAEHRITDEDREYWCFQPLTHPDPPVFDGDDWSRTDIDRFLFARLREAGLTPQPETDRVTLIRRTSQLVTGLPPTVEEVDAFLSDDSPEAYAKLIDRLLDSPRRGEHLARFWLDLVRYAESDGYKADYYRPQAWRYRDYVIDAFNSDKPYDLFVMEQLAGDEIAPHDPLALAATGYLRAGIYEYNQRDAEGQWKTMIEDVTDTTADTFLALGLGCAKCHDHKFDPILQSDYYQLQAFFSNVGLHNDTPIVTPEQLTDHKRRLVKWEEATTDIRTKLDEMERPVLEKLERDAVNPFVPELRAIWHKPVEERTAYERPDCLPDRTADFRQTEVAGLEVQGRIEREARRPQGEAQGVRQPQTQTAADRHDGHRHRPAAFTAVRTREEPYGGDGPGLSHRAGR